jgi:predicted acyl esterase
MKLCLQTHASRAVHGVAVSRNTGTPGQPVRALIPLTYVGHRVPAGSRLRLLVSGSNFPWADPNPHTGEPIATPVAMRTALQTVFHDKDRPSTLTLPILP